MVCAPRKCRRSLFADVVLQSPTVTETITTYTVVASAFLSAVAFINGRTQQSVDDLKKDVDGKFDDLKKDVDGKFDGVKKDFDGKFALSFFVSVSTLAVVVNMAVAKAGI